MRIRTNDRISPNKDAGGSKTHIGQRIREDNTGYEYSDRCLFHILMLPTRYDPTVPAGCAIGARRARRIRRTCASWWGLLRRPARLGAGRGGSSETAGGLGSAGWVHAVRRLPQRRYSCRRMCSPAHRGGRTDCGEDAEGATAASRASPVGVSAGLGARWAPRRGRDMKAGTPQRAGRPDNRKKARFYDYRGVWTRARVGHEGGYGERFFLCPPRLPPSALCYVLRTSPLWL